MQRLVQERKLFGVRRVLTTETRGLHARCTAECVHLESGILGDDERPRRARVEQRLLPSVLVKGCAGFRRGYNSCEVAQCLERDRQTREDLANLPHLVWIGRRDDQRSHHGIVI